MKEGTDTRTWVCVREQAMDVRWVNREWHIGACWGNCRRSGRPRYTNIGGTKKGASGHVEVGVQTKRMKV